MIRNRVLPIFQRNVGETFLKQSDLFDNSVYIPEICDVINIALAELPALLSVQEMAETLLHVKHGPEIICWMVANSPDTFSDGAYHILFYFIAAFKVTPLRRDRAQCV